MIKQKRLSNKGFTLVELMIATAVFAMVLLVCTYGLLEVGRTYYKGVTTTRTQEAARVIIDDITEAIQFNGGGGVELHAGDGWHCVGTKRYSFAINRLLTETNHALVTDTVPSCTSGTGRQAQMDGGGLTDGSRELINTRTRLSRFDVEEIGDNLYRVTVRVVNGEDDMLVDRNNDGNINTVDNPIECKNERSGSHFCAASELTTVVQKRV